MGGAPKGRVNKEKAVSGAPAGDGFFTYSKGGFSMENEKNLSALLQFESMGELKGIMINANTDQEEKLIKKALSKLIKPTLLSWIIGKLS
jgi:hypothetical protein